ncbi:MAG: hypothetical protein EON88_34875, partial [Brevundimonas sp.]
MFATYIVASDRNGSIYTGSSDDLARRVWEHKSKVQRGHTAKYDIAKLVWFEWHETREAAFTRERRIKEWPRVWRLELIEKANPGWTDLYDALLVPDGVEAKDWIPASAGMSGSEVAVSLERTGPVITTLALTDFRSYASARLDVGPGPVVLHGPNGAGKTNVLEALSLFTPGKGLRGASAPEMGRREPGEAAGRAWAVALTLETPDGEVRLGTGVQSPGSARRIVRIDGETAQSGRFLDFLRPVWATPEQDRLFSDARAERLKFFDRLVFAADPGHATSVAVYEKALRERLRLLTDAVETGAAADALWLDALEQRLAESGARAVMARVAALSSLQA